MASINVLGTFTTILKDDLNSNRDQVKRVNVVVGDVLLRSRTLQQCLDPMWLPTFDDEKACDEEAMGERVGAFRLYYGDLVYAATGCTASSSFGSITPSSVEL